MDVFFSCQMHLYLNSSFLNVKSRQSFVLTGFLSFLLGPPWNDLRTEVSVSPGCSVLPVNSEGLQINIT